MSLKDDLQEIDGVGPKTADKIIAVVDDHETSTNQSELGTVRNLLERDRTRVAKSKLDAILD